MSYNCTRFKIKELNDFVIPIESLFKYTEKVWHPDRKELDNGLTVFTNCETTLIGRVIGNDLLHVIDIDCSGEGSGVIMNSVLEPAFRDSTGKLVASCIWEGGDSITKLTVEKGEITWDDIDI